jgi:Gluconate 2-dehydrogenase subunit 3
MNRREALARMVALTGGMMVGAEFFLAGCGRTDKKTAAGFTAAERALMDEIGETIIPATDTPGAKAVGIGDIMAMLVNDCYDDASQAAFHRGLGKVDEASRKRHGKSFLDSTPGERTALLSELDREQRAQTAGNPGSAPPHFFHMLKQLTLLGYFTSEIGCTQALRYVETPGAFHGDVPYRKGEKAWADPSSRPSWVTDERPGPAPTALR